MRLDLSEQVVTYVVSEVEEEAEHLAKVVAAYHGSLSVHVRVVVENFEQVAHLDESLFVAKHGAAPERLKNLIDGVLGVGTLYEHLLADQHGVVVGVHVRQLVDLLAQNVVQRLLHLFFVDSLLPLLVNVIKLPD